MNTIVVLWATPRSTSTAFEWMMRMRGDMTCFHEPFGEAWYQGPEARAPRLAGGPSFKPGLTYAAVLDRLRSAASERPVFSKDMAQFTDHLWTDEFLATFRHSFLIRDPAKVLASMERSYAKQGSTERFTRQELGFDAQRELFDRLCERDGAPPPVIDSDDLLEHPEQMVAVYCETVGVPFVAEALSWEPGERTEVLWYDRDGSSFHDRLMTSDGLRAQSHEDAHVDALPEEVRVLHDAFRLHYDHLHAHRLRAVSV